MAVLLLPQVGSAGETSAARPAAAAVARVLPHDTLDLYSHVILTMQRDAAAAFDAVIGAKA